MTTTITADDADILWSPYNWNVSGVRAKTINPGSYFSVLIAGSPSAITLHFDMTGLLAPYPQIAYRIDGGTWIVEEVAASVGLVIPTDNSWSKHLLEVVVKSATETQPRWATQATAVALTSITTPENGCTTEPIEERTLKVLIFGDSITEGVRTLNQTAPDDTDRNDSTIGWAYDLNRTLGAEVGVVGFGGQGWLNTGSGGVAAFPTAHSLLWGSGPARDLTDPVPDVIIINQGTNDGGNVTSAATTTLNALLAATPSTTLILVMRPFNGSHASELQAAIAACSDPSRVTYVNTAGWFNAADSSDALHPYGYTNVGKTSGLLAEAIRDALLQGGVFINNGGTAERISFITV